MVQFMLDRCGDLKGKHIQNIMSFVNNLIVEISNFLSFFLIISET